MQCEGSHKVNFCALRVAEASDSNLNATALQLFLCFSMDILRIYLSGIEEEPIQRASFKETRHEICMSVEFTHLSRRAYRPTKASSGESYRRKSLVRGCNFRSCLPRRFASWRSLSSCWRPRLFSHRPLFKCSQAVWCVMRCFAVKGYAVVHRLTSLRLSGSLSFIPRRAEVLIQDH